MGLYRLLLRLLPADFRLRHERELVGLLESLLERRRGVRRTIGLAGAATDVVRTAVRIRSRGLLRRAGLGGSRPFDTMRQDVAFAARALVRRPGFATTTALVLGLGVGASTTIFTVTRNTLLRPLPYADPDQIGIFWHHLGGPDGQRLPVLNPRDVHDFRAWSGAFETFTFGSGRELIVGQGPDARITDVGFVEAGFFEFFGRTPVHGRSILPADDRPGAPPVVMLSHRFWLDRYGGDPAAIGAPLRMMGEDFRVIGVLPADFRLHLPTESLFLRDAEVWAPARIGSGYSASRLYTIFTGFGRLRRGATLHDGQEDLDRMMVRIREQDPQVARAGVTAVVRRLRDDVVKDVRPTVLLLLAAVGMTLVVSCANAASLLLGRGHARAWELSVRTALGAGRGRIVLVILVESLVLGLAGAVLGLGFAWIGLVSIRAVSGGASSALDGYGIDAVALGFTVLISILTALVAGLIPAMRAAGGDPARVLVGSVRAGGTRRAIRTRNWLVAVEVASSLVLLVASGLLVRSLLALHSVDPGYGTDGRLTFRVALSGDAWPTASSRQELLRTLQAQLEGLPNVLAAGGVSQLPLSGRGYQQSYAYDEGTRARWESVSADGRYVTPGYLEAVGATLLAGRDLTWSDVGSTQREMLIDDRLAREAFPGVDYSDVVGRRLQIGPGESLTEGNSAEIVGVVRHLNLHHLARPMLTQLYFPMTLRGMFSGADHFSFVVWSNGAPESLVPDVRRRVEAFGPGVALQDLEPFEVAVWRARAPARLAFAVIGLFGLTTLMLASIGLYGLLSFVVRSRLKEIGIRVALGQNPRSVTHSIVRQGLRIVLPAAAVGLIGAGLVARVSSDLLFGVHPFDPLSYVTALGVLVASGLLACWAPACRATRIDPVQALRVE